MQPIVNPTREQMRDLRGLVYAFRNAKTGLFYVGQTTKSFRERYSYEWWDSADSRHLVDALKRHGYESFEVWFLEHSILDPVALNEREAYHARERNAYHPLGYNLAPAGSNGEGEMSEEYREALRHKNARRHVFKHIETGERFDIVNLSEFCRERGIGVGNLWRVIKEPGYALCGFTHPDTTQDDLDNRQFVAHGGPPGPYTLWRGGQRYVFGSVKRFVEEHGLTGWKVRQLLRGRIPVYHGFRLTEGKPCHIRFSRMALRSPDGAVYEFTSVRAFAAEMRLCRDSIHRVIRGELPSHKGWTLVKAVIAKTHR